MLLTLLLLKYAIFVMMYLLQRIKKGLTKNELWTKYYEIFKALNLTVMLNFLIEVYFEMTLVASVVKYDDLLFTTGGEILGSIFWFFCYISTTFVVPAILAYSYLVVFFDGKKNSLPLNLQSFSLS